MAHMEEQVMGALSSAETESLETFVVGDRERRSSTLAEGSFGGRMRRSIGGRAGAEMCGQHWKNDARFELVE